MKKDVFHEFINLPKELQFLIFIFAMIDLIDNLPFHKSIKGNWRLNPNIIFVIAKEFNRKNVSKIFYNPIGKLMFDKEIINNIENFFILYRGYYFRKCQLIQQQDYVPQSKGKKKKPPFSIFRSLMKGLQSDTLTKEQLNNSYFNDSSIRLKIDGPSWLLQLLSLYKQYMAAISTATDSSPLSLLLLKIPLQLRQQFIALYQSLPPKHVTNLLAYNLRVIRPEIGFLLFTAMVSLTKQSFDVLYLSYKENMIQKTKDSNAQLASVSRIFSHFLAKDLLFLLQTAIKMGSDYYVNGIASLINDVLLDDYGVQHQLINFTLSDIYNAAINAMYPEQPKALPPIIEVLKANCKTPENTKAFFCLFAMKAIFDQNINFFKMLLNSYKDPTLINVYLDKKYRFAFSNGQENLFSGGSFLHFALRVGNIAIFPHLMKEKIDLDIKDNKGLTIEDLLLNSKLNLNLSEKDKEKVYTILGISSPGLTLFRQELNNLKEQIRTIQSELKNMSLS